MSQARVESTEESARRRKKYFCVRSSATFFAQSGAGMETQISFLNHYLLRHEIAKVMCVLSLREKAVTSFAGNGKPIFESANLWDSALAGLSP